VLLYERKTETLHVMEVPVKGCRRDAGELGDLAQAQRVETPARRQLRSRGGHQLLPGFFLLLLSRDLQAEAPHRA
jgi:hypothetical protein